jgi:hypothetical protein
MLGLKKRGVELRETRMISLKRFQDAIVWFFGTLFGVPSVIDRPLPLKSRRHRPRFDSPWVKERMTASESLGRDELSSDEVARLHTPTKWP